MTYRLLLASLASRTPLLSPITSLSSYATTPSTAIKSIENMTTSSSNSSDYKFCQLCYNEGKKFLQTTNNQQRALHEFYQRKLETIVYKLKDQHEIELKERDKIIYLLHKEIDGQQQQQEKKNESDDVQVAEGSVHGGVVVTNGSEKENTEEAEPKIFRFYHPSL